MLPADHPDFVKLRDVYDSLQRGHDGMSNGLMHLILFSCVYGKDKEIQAGYLKLCIRAKNVGLLKLALDEGIDPNADCSFVRMSMMPIHMAVDRGSVEMVKMLIEKGANVNALSSWGHTPMVHSNNRSTSITMILLQHGGKFPKRFSRGMIPTWQRGLIDYVDMMILLLKMEILPKELLRELSKFFVHPKRKRLEELYYDDP